MDSNNDTDIYGLVTELSKHILEKYRPSYQNVQFDYDCDVKRMKRLRTKAFEILLKKINIPNPDQYCVELEKRDPVVEIQKHAFTLRVGSRRSYEADRLETLLEELEAVSELDPSICSVLQFLMQLKDSSVGLEPIDNIFYYGQPNPALPEISHTDAVPPFQIYPMECFTLSDKLEATLEPQRLQITRTAPKTIMNEFPLMLEAIKSCSAIGIESMDVAVPPTFMSSHVFDTVSSQTLISANVLVAKSSLFDAHISQEILVYDDEDEIERIFPPERGAASYINIPSTRAETIIIENESYAESVTDKLNYAASIWDYEWSWIDADPANAFNYRKWEYFGEMQPAKESPFLTDVPAATIHLAKIKQTSCLPLLPEKIMSSVMLLEEISIKELVSDVKLMLLGIETDTFAYSQATGFSLRKNVNVYGMCLESLEETCREAISWGNCFKFLSHFVTPDVQSGKLIQEGLIFKAMCTSIKELLLYYKATLLKIFSCKYKTEGVLQTFQKVRPVAALIAKIAEFCKPYKEKQCTLKEGNGILTRIYDEAIKVTDTKVALVFYSLLKSCCDVYFRFLQKWMFEGICDDIYGEFMIKTRSQYLRSRGHKFWTKSFTICNEAVPGFLSGLTESILQCGKTVRLLRICDPKNPVCHVCVTEQPEVNVCLSETALREQSSRCQEYEEKGKLALGPIFSLSTAILHQKRLEKEMAENVVRAQRDTLLRIREEREDALKKVAQTKRDLLANLKEQFLMHQKRKENESSNKASRQNENAKHESTVQEKLRRAERANIINYYENLTNDVDKRCIRSQWRARRMTFYDKRIDALTNEQRNSQVETSAALEDENKNYSTSYRTVIGATSDSTSIDISQRNTTQSSAREAINNNNEKSNFRDFLDNQRLEELSEKIFSNSSQNKNTTATTAAVDNIDQLIITTPSTESDILQNLPAYRKSRTSTIERPTFLNVRKVDNMATESQMGNRLESLNCNMTPNNNELEIVTPNANDLAKKLDDREEDAAKTNQENDLETPISFLDNFASSVQTPSSPARNSEILSEASSSEESNSPNAYLKSPAAIKEDATFSDLFAAARAEPIFTSSATPAAPLTVSDVEILDHTSLQVYLEKSIRIPLNVQSHLVNNAVINYFLNENNLLLHLHSLRSYFFLLNGEFAKSLTDSLYTRLYEIAKPIELFNSATLMNLLERALVNSFHNVYINSKLLNLSAMDTPSQLYISDPSALDCLSLNYKINWPLNIILDETVMQQYGKVFKFLITSGRVSWVLQEDFNIMKRERKAATSEQYHKKCLQNSVMCSKLVSDKELLLKMKEYRVKTGDIGHFQTLMPIYNHSKPQTIITKLQLYRHSMTQFMNALHNYLTCSVLHASWTEFEKDLENSLTVDQIYLSHINYVKRILSRCMLNVRGEKVRICLNNIFKVILKFHNRLRSQSWTVKSAGCVHPNFKKLEQMYRAFCELRTYMAHIAFKLATSGYQPHLMHFLNALNINHLYDLTAKTHGSSTGSS